jgi:hypothetical protein
VVGTKVNVNVKDVPDFFSFGNGARGVHQAYLAARRKRYGKY